MIVNVVRYGLLLITGKRKIIKPSNIRGCQGEKQLYSQFRLFEVLIYKRQQMEGR